VLKASNGISPDATITVTVTVNAAGGGTTYALTVTNGTGSGAYAAGQNVTITANAAGAGQVFDKWVLTSGGGTLANVNSASTTYTMPGNAATVTATYKAAPAVDNAALNTRIAAIGGTAKGNYTDASWSAFQSALTAARATANNAGATQTQVNEALSALNAAYGNLQLKKMIFSTKYEATFGNWLMFFLLFGFIWMWF
jgi:hypothetical protein